MMAANKLTISIVRKRRQLGGYHNGEQTTYFCFAWTATNMEALAMFVNDVVSEEYNSCPMLSDMSDVQIPMNM